LTLARSTATLLSGHRLTCILWAGALLGLLGEIALMLTTAYLIDLAVSLMELWAELARKHMELTLTAFWPFPAAVPWSLAGTL
jgi:phenylalanyl-tRNA synthetase beta subunit